MSTGFFPDYILMFDNFADFSLIFAEKKKKSKPQKISDKRKRRKVLFLSFKRKFYAQVISYSLQSDSFEMSFFESLDWCLCETQQVTKFAILC